MIDVHIQGPTGEVLEQLTTTDPGEAEAHYLRLVQNRGLQKYAVVLKDADNVLTPAKYRLDAGWENRPREQVVQRFHQMWATPEEGWSGPTSEQMKGLLLAGGVKNTALAKRLGVSPRTWRNWVATPTGGGNTIPFSAWVAALRLVARLPDDEYMPREVMVWFEVETRAHVDRFERENAIELLASDLRDRWPEVSHCETFGKRRPVRLEFAAPTAACGGPSAAVALGMAIINRAFKNVGFSAALDFVRVEAVGLRGEPPPLCVVPGLRQKLRSHSLTI